MSAILPCHLADAHHQVRMLVAMSVERYADLNPLITCQYIFTESFGSLYRFLFHITEIIWFQNTHSDFKTNYMKSK